MITQTQRTSPTASSSRIPLQDLEIPEVVLKALDGTHVKWKSGTVRGLEYVREGSVIRKGWEERWPSGVALPAWDLVGRMQMGKSKCWEWVCVKVFQNPEELNAGSPPGDHESQQKIRTLFQDAKGWAHSTSESDWSQAGFEFTSLIALRSCLSSQGSCGKMVLVCVGGTEWPEAIAATQEQFRIGVGRSVQNRLHWIHLTPRSSRS